MSDMIFICVFLFLAYSDTSSSIPHHGVAVSDLETKIAQAPTRNTRENIDPEIQADLSNIEKQLPIVEIDSANIVGDVSFYLYTILQPDKPIMLADDWYYLDPKKTTKYIIHDWLQTAKDPVLMSIKDAYLAKRDYNVILVDWNLQANLNYSESAFLSTKIGKVIAEKITEVDPDHYKQAHLIGHGIGAHISGIAGKVVQKIKAGRKVPRITALDPAGPIFKESSTSNNIRLAKSDAEIVDVTHTDGDYYGWSSAIGTVDFFPNGGKRPQEHCKKSSTNPYQINCHHSASVLYFLESIYSSNFIAQKCLNWKAYLQNECGENSSGRPIYIVYGEDMPSAQGNYFFKTHCRPPYALGYNKTTCED